MSRTWLSKSYNIDRESIYDDELLRYVISQVDSTSIGKNIHIVRYYLTTLRSSATNGIFISYELDKCGFPSSWCVEEGIFILYEKRHKEKIRIEKIKNLMK